MQDEERSPIRLAYERRNRDLDSQLVWRGKDEQDLDDLAVSAPPLYIQERVHPKALVDDLMRQSRNGRTADEYQADMFADFPLSLTTGHWTQVTVRGVDVFHPNTGEIRSDGPDGIACWFIDTDYNAEAFFVRHAYFLGAGDPYKSLKTTLNAEIDADAWATLHSDTSCPFDKPESGRIAVKVINHLGDEVLKVFRVE